MAEKTEVKKPATPQQIDRLLKLLPGIFTAKLYEIMGKISHGQAQGVFDKPEKEFRKEVEQDIEGWFSEESNQEPSSVPEPLSEVISQDGRYEYKIYMGPGFDPEFAPVLYAREEIKKESEEVAEQQL